MVAIITTPATILPMDQLCQILGMTDIGTCNFSQKLVGVIKEKGAEINIFDHIHEYLIHFSLFLGVDRNDIPLLMAVASAHTPNLRSSLALIPQ